MFEALCARTIVIPLALALLGAAGTSEPVTILEKIYEPYLEDRDSYVMRQYGHFSKRLRALIQADHRRMVEDAEYCVDFDPFVAGQDYEIRGLTMQERKRESEATVVTVKFLNFGQPKRLDFRFLREEAAWRIDDIEASDGWKLSKEFACDPDAN